MYRHTIYTGEPADTKETWFRAIIGSTCYYCRERLERDYEDGIIYLNDCDTSKETVCPDCGRRFLTASGSGKGAVCMDCAQARVHNHCNR